MLEERVWFCAYKIAERATDVVAIYNQPINVFCYLFSTWKCNAFMIILFTSVINFPLYWYMVRRQGDEFNTMYAQHYEL